MTAQISKAGDENPMVPLINELAEKLLRQTEAQTFDISISASIKALAYLLYLQNGSAGADRCAKLVSQAIKGYMKEPDDLLKGLPELTLKPLS